MRTVHMPLYSSSGGTESTAFIQFVNCPEHQIHELWCLGVDGISQKVNPTARVEVPDGTIVELVTNYLDENGL